MTMSLSLCKTFSVLAALCRVVPMKGANTMKTRSYILPNSLLRLALVALALLGLFTGSPAKAQKTYLLVTSSNDSAVKRYDGTTGAYIDDFIPSGSGGLKYPGG